MIKIFETDHPSAPTQHTPPTTYQYLQHMGRRAAHYIVTVDLMNLVSYVDEAWSVCGTPVQDPRYYDGPRLFILLNGGALERERRERHSIMLSHYTLWDINGKGTERG